MWIATLFASGNLTTQVSDYFVLLSAYSGEFWPVQLFFILICLWLVRFVYVSESARLLGFILALFHIWLGSVFFAMQMSQISAISYVFAGLFIFQGLLWWTVLKDAALQEPGSHIYSKIGFAIYVCCVVLPPAIAPFSNKFWWQVPLVGMMPTPTAIASLGLMFLCDTSRRWMLMLIPTFWCFVAGTMSFLTNSMAWFVPPALAILLIILVFSESLFYRKSPNSH